VQALVINLLGCIWYYTARVGGIRPGNTWLSDVCERFAGHASGLGVFATHARHIAHAACLTAGTWLRSILMDVMLRNVAPKATQPRARGVSSC
jgi:hypothetical protein